jgi:hypothetical protein
MEAQGILAAMVLCLLVGCGGAPESTSRPAAQPLGSSLPAP